MLGDINVGKTNIVRCILGEPFEEMEATIGAEFGEIMVKFIDKSDPDIVVSIQIWDTCIQLTQLEQKDTEQ